MSVFVKRARRRGPKEEGSGEEGSREEGSREEGSREGEPGAACQKLFSYRGLDVRAVRRCAGDRRSPLNRCSDGAPIGCPKCDPGGVPG